MGRSNERELLEEHGIVVVSEPSAFDVHFTLASLEALHTTEDRHFWSVTKGKLIADLIRRYCSTKTPRILDIGCGNGGLLQSLAQVMPGATLAGIDGHGQALLHCRRRSADAQLILADILHLDQLPPTESFDVAVFADVLEHVDDPEAVLAGARSLLTPRGIIIVTVPASMALWSERDVFLGHRKRYVRPQLVRLLRAAHCTVLHSTYAFSYLYLPALLFRKLLAPWVGTSGENIEATELRIVPVMNTLLIWIGSIEIILSRFLPLPFGTSAVCVARKE